MLILAIILLGLVVGAACAVGAGPLGPRHRLGARLIAAGLIGSFVGGLLGGLIAGDGIRIRPSGLIGSFIGALIVTALWRWWQSRHAPAPASRGRAR